MNTNLDDSSGSNPPLPDPIPLRQQPRALQLPDGSEILNKAEVARRLGVTERHIEYLIKARRIPHLRLGSKSLRFVWADVLREFTVSRPANSRALH